MNSELCIVLTARMNSERLPGKAMIEVAHRPMLYWITRRLQRIGNVVIATTALAEDNAIELLAYDIGVACYRGSTSNVVERMDYAYKRFFPEARYIQRGFGDCPFMAAELIDRSLIVMDRYHKDTFAWALEPSVIPVYGSYNFPYGRDAWERVVAEATTPRYQEHVDLYFFEHRDQFDTAYHEPPPSVYLRSYRLEVDYPQDMELVRKIAQEAGMLATVPAIIRYLDANNDIAQLNAECVERTGPSRLSYQVKRDWMRAMRGRPIVGWDNNLWSPPGGNSKPVFCSSGKCFIGHARNGILYTRSATIEGEARIDCACGSGLHWKAPKHKGSNWT